MWRQRLMIAGVAWSVAACGHTSSAHGGGGGALSSVVGGLHSQAESHGYDPPSSETRTLPRDSSSDSSGAGSSSSSSPSWTHDDGKSGSECCSIEPYSTMGYAYGSSTPSGQVVTDLYLGGQDVVNSDGAMTVEVAATYDNFGVGGRASTFYEKAPSMLHTDYLHLDLWWLGALWRLDHDEKYNVWLELGFTGLSDHSGLTMSGASAGVHVDRALAGAIKGVGGARFAWFQYDVHESELWLGLRMSIMQVAYRVTYFDVGPPLHGPEVGVALTF